MSLAVSNLSRLDPVFGANVVYYRCMGFSVSVPPYTVAPRRKVVRIQAVLDCFMDFQHCLVVPAVHVRYLICKHGMGSIFSIASLCAFINRFANRRNCFAVADAVSRKQVESLFFMKSDDDI